MKRREFILFLATAAISELSPAPSSAQSAPGTTIGYLSSRSAESDAPFVAAFLRGLNEAGAAHANIEFRFADSQESRLEGLAADLVSRKPAVILAAGGSTTARVLKKLTSTIPIVFVNGADPVRTGLVRSMNKPGGNVTGVSFLATQIVAKRLELLLAFVPNAKRIAVLTNPQNPDSLAQIVTSLGGSVIYGAPTLQFDLPLEKAREVIPELNKLGVGCRKLRERTGDHPTQLSTPMSIATIECYRPKEEELKELREAWFQR